MTVINQNYQNQEIIDPDGDEQIIVADLWGD